MKKVFGLLLLAVTAVVLVACKKSEFKVTFDSQGGSSVDTLLVKKNELATEPSDPTRSTWNLVGWYTTKDYQEGKEFNFYTTKITGNLTLYAVWSKEVVVRFDTKIESQIAPKFLGVNGGEVTAPTAPERKDFVFKGWYNGKAGQTWLEETAVTFPLQAQSNTRLYAYWEPVNSKTANWSKGETYLNSFTELTADPVLNPTTYTYSHENDLMSYLSTPLYGTDVNWDKAIADGLASKKGDLSKLNESNIGALLRENIKIGAARFPIAVDGTDAGEDGTDSTGKFSEAISRNINARTYRYTLRDDIFWEDGTPVTADDYFYSYFTFIDPIQNNGRATSYYPTADRASGAKIVNARRYFLQGTIIGGTTNDAKLATDYSKYNLTAYVTEDGKLESVGTRLTLDSEFKANDFVVGDVTYKAGLWPGLDAYMAKNPGEYSFKVTENPYYVGEKGTEWPAITKEEVGFKKIDDYTFEMTFEVLTNHSSALSTGDFRLVHEETYRNSLDKNLTNSTYGTSVTKPLSYGGYVLKTWDTGQKIVLNKNYKSFVHKNYNYKSISFEFYSNIALKMQAFDSGDLSVTGLNQTYYSKYAEDPNKKDSHRGYSHYLMINTNNKTGDEAKKVSILKDKDFRQALFFGFNRIEYTKTVFSPNLPTFTIYGGINNTQYDNDPEWYTHTSEYNAMLSDLGIDLSTYGYNPTKAKELFNRAYANWTQTEGVTGPLVLNYLTEEGAESERIDKYIVEHYENLFDGKLKIERKAFTSDVQGNKQDAYEFDITLTQVGYGSITNTSVMAPAISLFAKELGLKFGFNSISDLGIPESVFTVTEANKLDLRKTYEYLKNNRSKFDETTDEGTLLPMYNILDANQGYFIGDIRVIYRFGLDSNFIWAGLAPQYDGDVTDRNTVTRAFDRVVLEWVPLVPIASMASAVVYAKNVVNTWPAYHNIMQWGQARYSFLNTDPDFR